MSAIGVGQALRHSQIDARRLRLVGDTVGHERRKDDFYATPPEATRALLAVESFEGTILEPACGDGAISEVLEATGHAVRSTDLIDHGYGDDNGWDFLGIGYPYHADNIITNPPFKLTEQFIERSLQHTSRKVAMLLKLGFLEGSKRSRLLRKTPLAKVWVFAERLTFRIPDREKQGNGMLAFCWAVFDHDHRGPPTIGWLFRDEHMMERAA